MGINESEKYKNTITIQIYFCSLQPICKLHSLKVRRTRHGPIFAVSGNHFHSGKLRIMATFKLDPTAFHHHTTSEAEKSKVFSNSTFTERLRIAYYLNSAAYGFINGQPPKMNKGAFSIRKRA